MECNLRLFVETGQNDYKIHTINNMNNQMNRPMNQQNPTMPNPKMNNQTAERSKNRGG